jgi:hypothetical protein
MEQADQRKGKQGAVEAEQQHPVTHPQERANTDTLQSEIGRAGGTRTSLPAPPVAPRRSLPWRALLLGILLTPLCCYWAQDQPIDRIFSLMVPPMALTMIAALLNAPVRRFFPRWALGGGELMIVYALLATACTMASEWMDITATQVYGYAIYAERNPAYGERILPHLSHLLFFTDPAPLRDFASGTQSFAVFARDFPLWLPKVLGWTVLFGLVTTAMLCINTLLCEQWIHVERLPFPLVQIPLALAQENKGSAVASGGGAAPASLGRSPLFWGGFLVIFVIDNLNGLSFLYPALPHINVRFLGDMNTWFTSPPWNQTGWTPIGLFVFLSAIGFFMPTDLLFSVLFFFFVRKAQQIIAYSIGNEQGVFGGGGLVPAPPYFSEQSWGAFLGLFVSAMWLARPHWRKVWHAIVTGDDPSAFQNGAVPHRFSFGLLLVCIAGMGVVGLALGLPLLWVVFYTLLFLAFSVAVTRLRAQLGAPTHEMAFMGPHQLVFDFHGTAGIGAAQLTGTMTAFHFMNRIHRTHPMPTLLEGLYLADRTGMSQRAMFGALVAAVLLGSAFGHLSHIYLGYRWQPTAWPSSEVAGVVSSLQSTPRPPNPSAMGAVGAGFAVVMLLDFIRFRVPGFWLHPAGYALAMNFGVDYYWFGLLIVLIVKTFVQRYYGLRGYGQLRQVALGLILGEFAAETLWAVFSMLNDRQATYSISINGKMGWDQ